MDWRGAGVSRKVESIRAAAASAVAEVVGSAGGMVVFAGRFRGGDVAMRSRILGGEVRRVFHANRLREFCKGAGEPMGSVQLGSHREWVEAQ